jgi:hypothetical protein
VVAVPEEIGGELMLTKPEATGVAFGHGVLPAELIEENPLFVVQLARPTAIEVDDAIAVERNGVAGGNCSVAERTPRVRHTPYFLARALTLAHQHSQVNDTLGDQERKFMVNGGTRPTAGRRDRASRLPYPSKNAENGAYFAFEVLPAPFAALVVVIFVATI